jgi:crossover junction endodeoxyribonuclease RuvC
MPEAIPTILRIVALDLSLNSTGVATTAHALDDVETWVLKTKLTGMERLAWLRLRITEIATGPWEEASVVVLEGYSFGSQGRAVFQIGEAGGVVRLALHDLGIPVVEIAPSALKKYATGSGNAPKDAVLQAAVIRSGHIFQTNDCADAWWLHQMASAHYGLPHIPMPALNRAVLDKIVWPTLTLEVVA